MLERKIDEKLMSSRASRHALLVSGMLRTGKTAAVRKYGKKCFSSFTELSFRDARILDAFRCSTDSDDFMMRISLFLPPSPDPDDSLIFFDDVELCPEIITMVKFLVEKGRHRYILAGRITEREIRSISSVPVGYMDRMEMHPLDFEEFAWASGIGKEVFRNISECREKVLPVDETVHRFLNDLYRKYLVVGGMPECVEAFVDTRNLGKVLSIQKEILEEMRSLIIPCDRGGRTGILDVFSLVPRELSSRNKRFIHRDMERTKPLLHFEKGMRWLRESGFAIPAYSLKELARPLLLSRADSLVKLFMADTGLLSAALDNSEIILDTLSGRCTEDYGALYENAAAMELKALGYDLYYFNSKKNGEIDFVIEDNGKVIPIEIKSGKEYPRHRALSNIMKSPEYDIEKAYVLSDANVDRKGKIFYMPIYMLGMLGHRDDDNELRIDLDIGILEDSEYIDSLMKQCT